MKRFLMVIGALVLSFGGCVAVLKVKTSSIRKADAAPIERRREEARAQLDRLKRVAALMKDHAPLDADSETLPLSKVSFKKCGEPAPDGAFVDERQLADEMRNLRYETQTALIEGLRKRTPGVVTHGPDYYRPDLEKRGY